LISSAEVHLKDLLYITDGNENYVDKEKGILNLYKMDAIGKTMSIFIQTHGSYAQTFLR